MQPWTDIISNALLGTDKQPNIVTQWPADMEAAIALINSNTAIDREEKFLQAAALVFNYRQSGVQPLQKDAAVMPVAPEETRPYCNAAAVQAFRDIMAEDNAGLLRMWLERCAVKQQLAHPFMLPALFNKAVEQKSLQLLVEICVGERGRWLTQFNTDWQFGVGAPPEELWATGSLPQRKEALSQMGLTDAATARTWLQQTWAQENANTRAELLNTLRASVFAEDSSWLETLLSEKSQKVKEAAIYLLQQLPGSSIIQRYWEVAKQAITLKKEKAMLGLSSKTVLHVELPAAIDEEIFKTGIERLSSDKKVSDEDHILEQLVSAIPPHLWESHLEATPDKILAMFTGHPEAARFYHALESAACRFRNVQWATLFAAEGRHFYWPLMQVLEPAAQEQYLVRMLGKAPQDVMEWLRKQFSGDWSLSVTRAALKYTAQTPYHYNRLFYSQRIQVIPVEIAAELDRIGPAQEGMKESWNEVSAHIRKLLALKQQIIKAFQ